MKTIADLKQAMLEWWQKALQKTSDTQYCICYKSSHSEYQFITGKTEKYNRILIGIEYYNSQLKKQCFAESIALNSRDNWEAFDRASKNLATYQAW